MNMWLFRLIVLSFTLSLLVACGGGASSSSNSERALAMEKIKLYASDSSNSAPTMQDYKDAGVSGLENIDIDKLNEKVASLTLEDVDTVEELDAITANLGINITPFASAGVDQSMVEGATVAFDGSASSDSDGTISAWLWKEGGTTLSTSQSFSKNDFSVGTHIITLKVVDNDGASSSDTVEIKITAKATTKENAIDRIKLYATDSSNPAPTLQDYKDAGVSGLDKVDITKLNQKVASLNSNDVDTVAKLNVIVASLVTNIPPVTNAGIDQTVVEGVMVTLDGSASSDSDGTISAWLWKEGGTTLSTSQSFSKNDFSVGTHIITLKATDNDGASSSDTIEIKITAKATTKENAIDKIKLYASDSSNPVPTLQDYKDAGVSGVENVDITKLNEKIASLTADDVDTVGELNAIVAGLNTAPVANAGADQSVVEDEIASLDGSASSDSDGTITAWLWKEGSTTLSTSQSFSKNDFSVGVHTITLEVTDNDGASDSDTVVITITAKEASGLFTISPISDVSIPEYTFFDSLDYLPADKDEAGHYTSITPSLVGGTPVDRVVYTLDGADAEEFIVNKKTGIVYLDYKDYENPTDANKDNVYEVTLTVTDEAGNTDSESWKVTVTDVAGDAATKHHIVMNGASLMRVKAGQTFVDPGVTVAAFDNGANVALSSMIVSNYNLDPQLPSIDTNNPNDRVYHIIYSADDSADENLSAPQMSRTVIVEDNDNFASLGAIVTANVTGTDSSQKTFTSLEEDYIQKALYYARDHGGGVVHLSSGMHYFKRQLVIYSNTTLEGTLSNAENTTTLKLMDFAIKKAWKNNSLSFGNISTLITNGSAPSENFQYIADKTEESSQNITIKNMIINGNRERQRSWRSAGSNNSIGIDIHNTAGIYIDHIFLLNTLSDGISTGSSSNLNVRNSSFRFMGHSALFIVETTGVTTDNLTIDVLSNSGIRLFGGTDFTITNNHIFCTTNGGNYAIQISNNYSGGKPVENVLIENNIIRHTAYAGIALYTSTVNDVIQGVTIQNNIIYGASSVVSNMSHIVAKEPNSRIHEGGGIDIQHAKQVNINHNTIFNNQGSGIRLDNRFYIPDGTDEQWNDLKELDRMPGKTASISNNIIVGNEVSAYEGYSDAVAFGIEKRVALYCGANQNEECAGTTVTGSNNIFALNRSGKASSNITLNATNNAAFPGFVDAPVFNHDIREISYYYDDETKPDFNLVGVADPQIGAPKSILQKNLDTYAEYRSFFTPLPD